MNVCESWCFNFCNFRECFNGKGTRQAWLFAIARNRCLDEVRRPQMLRDEEVGMELVDPAANPVLRQHYR